MALWLGKDFTLLQTAARLAFLLALISAEHSSDARRSLSDMSRLLSSPARHRRYPAFRDTARIKETYIPRQSRPVVSSYGRKTDRCRQMSDWRSGLPRWHWHCMCYIRPALNTIDLVTADPRINKQFVLADRATHRGG